MVFRPLAGLPIPECVRKLGDGKDALLPVCPNLLLTHTPQEAKVIVLDGQVVAPLTELADLAVLVQDQLGRCIFVGHLPNFLKNSFGLPQVLAETDSGGLTLPPVPDHTVGGRSPLDPREEQAVDFQKEPLPLADLPSLVEQHGDVMEVSQDRRLANLLQAVEDERMQVVFKNGVQHERRPLPQGCAGQGDVSRHFLFGVPCRASAHFYDDLANSAALRPLV